MELKEEDISFIEGGIKGEEEERTTTTNTPKKIKSPKINTYFSDQNEFVLHCYKLAALRKFPIYTAGNPAYRLVRCEGSGRGEDKCSWFIKSNSEKGGKGGTVTERENAHTCVIEYPDEVEQKMLSQVQIFEKRVDQFIQQEEGRNPSPEIEGEGQPMKSLKTNDSERKLSKYPLLNDGVTQAAIERLLAQSPGIISLPASTVVHEECSTLVVLCAASAKSKGFVIRRQEIYPNSTNPIKLVYLCGHYYPDKAPNGVKCSYRIELKNEGGGSRWYLVQSGKHNHTVKGEPKTQNIPDRPSPVPIASTSTPKLPSKSSTVAPPVPKMLPLISRNSTTKRPLSPEIDDDVVILQRRQLPTPVISEPSANISPIFTKPRLQSIPTPASQVAQSSSTPTIATIKSTIETPLTMDMLKSFLYSVSPTIARFTSKFWEGGIRSKASLFYLCEMLEPELIEALTKVELGPLQRVLFVDELKKMKGKKSY